MGKPQRATTAPPAQAAAVMLAPVCATAQQASARAAGSLACPVPVHGRPPMPQRRSCSRRLVSRILVRVALWLLVLLAPAAAAVAACLPMAGAPEGPVPAGTPLAGRSALLRPAALAAGGVERTSLGHSSFLIRSPDGVTAITDYNGYVRGPLVPTIVTMNNAHDTHFTESVEPGVRHVL